MADEERAREEFWQDVLRRSREAQERVRQHMEEWRKAQIVGGPVVDSANGAMPPRDL
jgi:hypothetical protein